MTKKLILAILLCGGIFCYFKFHVRSSQSIQASPAQEEEEYQQKLAHAYLQIRPGDLQSLFAYSKLADNPPLADLKERLAKRQAALTADGASEEDKANDDYSVRLRAQIAAKQK